MNVSRVKEIIGFYLPKPAVNILKIFWHFGRRNINRWYFKIFHRHTVMLDVIRSEEGQLNQPIVIDFILRGAVDGFFLDVGANHPEFNSNTHFFETRRNYRGVAFDPLEQYKNEWAETRPKSIFMNVAAGAVTGTVRFYQHANTDGWADQLSFTGLSNNEDISHTTSRIVNVIPLADVEGLPMSVSFASIDVEGAEHEVLKGFKDSLRPQVLVVENCFGPIGDNSLRERVRSMGYMLVARISYIDDVYVRTDLIGDMPNLHGLRRARRDLFR